MNFDFALILVIATLVSAFFWALGAFTNRRGILYEYGKSLFPVFLIVLLFRSFLFEPFKIPSGSMRPTLLVGDFILVNKYTYGLRLPVLGTKVLSLNEPQRGDVVVFKYPPNPKINYIKRLIGVPGDTIVYRNKRLFINGEPVAMDAPETYTGAGMKCERATPDAVLYAESLDGVNHPALLHGRIPATDGQWTVPPGHYFMMGDNRDQSADSRIWGFVPEKNLVGRAVRIWMSYDLKAGCGDFSRIGDAID